MIAGLRQAAMLWSLEWPAPTALLETSARVVLVVAAAAVVARLLHRRPAALRRALWLGTLAVTLTIGLVGVGATLRATIAPVAAWTSQSAPGAFADWPRLALWTWAFVAGVLVLRLCRAQRGLSRMLGDGTPLTSGAWADDARRIGVAVGLRRPVVVRVSQRVSSPFAAGVVHPSVVIPEAMHDAPAEWRESVLWHELTHVRRRDVAGHWVAGLACAVLWFHPWVWFAARRLRRECEHASDDAVLESGVTCATYVRQLVTLADRTTPQATPLGTIGFGASELRQRIEAIAEPRERGTLGPWSRIAVAMICAGLLGVALQLGLPEPRFAFFAKPTPAAERPASR